MLDYEYSSNSTYYHVSIDTLPYNIYHSGADRTRTEGRAIIRLGLEVSFLSFASEAI
jgi:hypothetical protein